MSWGTLRVGRFELAETYRASRQQHETLGTRTVTLTGSQYCPDPRSSLTTEAMVTARIEDVLGIKDFLVPIEFSQKSDMNGFYVVIDSGVTHGKWVGESTWFDWSLQLQYLGADTTVDLESRLSGTVRANGFALSGERWQAPPIGHYAYYTGTSTPSSSVARLTDSGTITVYRGLPASVSPRWGAAVAAFRAGRVHVDVGGIERAANVAGAAPASWVLSNGLVKVTPRPSGALLDVAVWNGAGWDSKVWNVARAGVNLAITDFSSANVLRNDMELVTVRLVGSRSPGRNMLDLTLRRGSRFVECYFQTDASATIATTLNSAETQTDNSASGYVVATGDDPNGDRFVAGCSKSGFTAIAGGGLQKTAVVGLDFFLGVVYNGGSAATGDGATAVRDQYLGALAERTTGVRR